MNLALDVQSLKMVTPGHCRQARCIFRTRGFPAADERAEGAVMLLCHHQRIREEVPVLDIGIMRWRGPPCIAQCLVPACFGKPIVFR